MELELVNKVVSNLSLKSSVSSYTEEDTQICHDSGMESPVHRGTPASNEVTASENSSKQARKNRSDSGCSYGTFDEAMVMGMGSSSKMTSHTIPNTGMDSGTASTEADDNLIYAYHFMIPAHLCGRSDPGFNTIANYVTHDHDHDHG